MGCTGRGRSPTWPSVRALTRAVRTAQERLRREDIGLGGSETEKTDGNPYLTAIVGGGLIIVLGALVTGTL